MATSPADTGLSSDGRDRGEPLEPSDLPEGSRRSALGIVRDLLGTLTQVVEDSTDLFGATMREELERFRSQTARLAVSGVAAAIGVCLLTAGLAIFLSDLIGSWSLTLVILGAAYLGLALFLQLGASKKEGDSR
jgi:hypothetical protein